MTSGAANSSSTRIKASTMLLAVMSRNTRLTLVAVVNKGRSGWAISLL